jgi:rSAM/selenodomain-associated transferase 2/rSAM/selenodomain-associated transferase 1
MDMPSERLILFTRYPEPGKTKTRLIPVLGPEGAAEFQRRLTEWTAEIIADACNRRQLSVEVRHEGGSGSLMRQWLGRGFTFRPQGPGDIGTRMKQSLLAAFEEGMERAVIIGSDIPGITSAILGESFEALNRCDLVFGPAVDGGYYLIGSTSAGARTGTPYLEGNIAWGSARALAQTLSRVRSAGLSYTLLEALADVDRPEDLKTALQALCRKPDRPAISAIIPALNEAGVIAEAVSVPAASPRVEVIVVDGGSRDATVEIATSRSTRVLVTRPMRGIQMNAGAAIASGDILLFLHADTRLSEGFADQVQDTLAGPGVAAGAFNLKIESSTRGLMLMERVANWRSRRLQMPYGDQALFLRREVFWELGGFPPLPIMEDFELVRRLRRMGRIAIAPGRATTSARRWLQVGVARTWLLNQLVVVAYLCGVSTHRLARWYRFNNS